MENKCKLKWILIGADWIGHNKSNLPVAVNDMLPWIVGCCKIMVFFFGNFVKTMWKINSILSKS